VGAPEAGETGVDEPGLGEPGEPGKPAEPGEPGEPRVDELGVDKRASCGSGVEAMNGPSDSSWVPRLTRGTT